MVHLTDEDEVRLKEALRDFAKALEDVAICGDLKVKVTELGDIHAKGHTDTFTKIRIDICDDWEDTRVRYKKDAAR